MLYDEASGHGGCYWFDHLDRHEIVERAQQLAEEQGRPIVNLEDYGLEGKLENYKLEDLIDFYEIHSALKVSDDESWYHSMDW